MGNCILDLDQGVTLIASDHTWIDGDAVKQLYSAAELPGMRSVAGMPDLHPGRGHPVGAAFFSTGRLYPALIGGDIGCGMALWRTGLDAGRIAIDKLEKKPGNLDGPLEPSWHALRDALAPAGSGFEAALGTIGGGNHFAELQRVEEVYDAAAVAALGVDERALLLLVHSGSRGLGQAILEEQLQAGAQHGIEAGSAACAAYLQRHALALAFAYANRELIARRMLDRLCGDDGAHRLLDLHHNFVEPADVAGVHGWLHRKGATPAHRGAVVIPGSRGDYSYLVQPIGDEEAGARSLLSLAHGAGRKWARSECRGRLARFTPQQLVRTRLGGHVICEDRALLYEEAPQAYKPIGSVVGALVEAGLARPLARLRPVLTYKTRGECCT